jgi:8-oxo-dGTP diphosphatase
MKENIFNVRVYGILINEKNELLITDEYRFEKLITKFPGGGLQFGEGTIDCIKREMMEETGIEMEVVNHFYTTDFFQPSAFNDKQQIISIYYLLSSSDEHTIETKEKPFDFDEQVEGAQIFRWVDLKNLKKEDFTFPIDQKVAEMIIDMKRNDKN